VKPENFIQISIPNSDDWTPDQDIDIYLENQITVGRIAEASPDSNIVTDIDVLSTSHLNYSRNELLTEDGNEIIFEGTGNVFINPRDLMIGTAIIDPLQSTSKLYGDIFGFTGISFENGEPIQTESGSYIEIPTFSNPRCRIFHTGSPVRFVGEISTNIIPAHMIIDDTLIVRKYNALSTHHGDFIKLSGGNVDDKYVRIQY
jgi:hypothetical protein